MRILIGCERSAVIRESMRRRGYDAWSCDLEPSDVPGNHIQGDLLNHLDDGWDLGIFHSECTYLANSGILRLVRGQLGVQKWLARGKPMDQFNLDRWDNLVAAAEFFRRVWQSNIPHVAVENPVMHGYAKHLIGCGDPTQTIQPFQFGEPESKRTCLWLRCLPRLRPTNILSLPESGHWNNQTPSGQNKIGPSKDRKAIRSKTYRGIAEAMADQWPGFIREWNDLMRFSNCLFGEEYCV
jgi:hypothetical protein